MTNAPDFSDGEDYRPEIVMTRVRHLPQQARHDIERIARIIRASFGYGDCKTPPDGRIVGITLVEREGDRAVSGDPVGGKYFHVAVNRPECADDAHWRLARAIIASEFRDTCIVAISVQADEPPPGIVLYGPSVDEPLNARELSFKA